MSYPIKRKTHDLFFGDPISSKSARVFNLIFITLIVSSIAVLILESVQEIERQFGPQLRLAEIFFVSIFTVEYFLRAWSSDTTDLHPRSEAAASNQGAPSPPHYVLSFHGIIDFLATAPFYLQVIFPGLDLRFLRAVRMLRILKLSHYNSALEDLFSAIYDERNSIVSAAYILGIAILITSCFAYYAEASVQPDKFGSIPDAMWWSIITLTTVGYGDVSPITAFGKVIGIFTAFAGVCTVAVLTGIVATSFTNQLTRKKVLFEHEARGILARGGGKSESEAVRKALNLTPQHASAILEKLKSESKKKE